MRLIQPVLVLLCAGVLFSPSASAYYHFLRYLSRTAPFTSIPQKYDLNVLVNKTVPYFVSETGPGGLAVNDSTSGLISQIRLAASVWDNVETSDLRLAFGGIGAGAGQGAPGIDIVFSDEIPPGLNALTSLQTAEPNATFVPITRATILLPRNMSQRPSYGEPFFLTMVHELGHALGLQHTFTSSAMSTEITRSMTKASPIAADDIAGLSLLYPARGFAASVGAISGRVTIGADGVAMASVVAIPSTGPGVSTITNPDGSFRMEGLPPGQYYVFAHPLPPLRADEATPGNIVLPVGPDNRGFASGPAFDTVFFPGTRDPQAAVTVVAGAAVDNVNFTVQRRNAPAISSVQTYGFIGQITTKPPMLNRTTGRGLVVASGAGFMSSPGNLVSGLNAATVGANAGFLNSAPRAYTVAPAFLQLDLLFPAQTTEGAHHMIFSAANDIYVLPSAYYVTSKAPPTVAAMAPSLDAAGARVVTIAGLNLDANSTILFDGHPAALRSFDEQTGRLTVAPPPAASNYRASVIAMNADGQSSLHAQGNLVSTYTYDVGEAAAFTVTPNALPAGSEAMVEITGSGLNLVDGLARAGFGNSDIAVRRVWVAGPNRLVANIVIAPTATPGLSTVTLTSGLSIVVQPGAFAIQAPGRQLTVQPSTAGVQPGTPVSLAVLNLPSGVTPAALTLTLNDQPVAVTAVANGQVSFTAPAALTPGPAVLRLRTATEAAPPVVLGVEAPPPLIAPVTAPVVRGETATFTVTGLLTDAFTQSVARNSVTVTVGGIEHKAPEIAATAQRGVYEVQIQLKESVPAGAQALTVTQGYRTSASQTVTVR
ncbi:MAG: matrixin family metalloprotease [Bryobacterales bacterium]|nr:matrixin family metalloprotease [Bryobacterales bacterium]